MKKKKQTLPAESRDDIPRVSVTLTDETAWITRYDAGGAPTITYPAAVDDIAGAFRGVGGVSTGVLPEGVLFWRDVAGQARLGLYLPPARRTITVASGRAPRRVSVPLPGLLLVGQGRQWWLHACRSRPAAETERLYRAPLPNVHDNGSICQGSARFPVAGPATLLAAAAVFFESEFNGDLAHGKIDGYDGNVTRFLAGVHGKFPAGRLVDSGQTLANAMGVGVRRETWN